MRATGEERVRRAPPGHPTGEQVGIDWNGRKARVRAAWMGFCFVLLAGASATTTNAQSRPYFESTEVVTKRSTVLAIDKAKRALTLKGDEGDTVVVPVKPEVKTFGQIKVGDRIKVVYTDRFTVYAADSASTDLVVEKTRADAKEGDAPQATITERATFGATISAIDREQGLVTLKDQRGDEFTLKPLNPENLSRVAVGSVVVFTMTHTTAASIEKLPPTKKVPTKKS